MLDIMKNISLLGVGDMKIYERVIRVGVPPVWGCVEGSDHNPAN
jgi:hypothetical protein